MDSCTIKFEQKLSSVLLYESISGADIISAINAQRKLKGLIPVSRNNKIDTATKIQAKQMAVTGQFGHVLRNVKYPNLDDRMRASGYAYYKAGEVLFEGNGSPNTIVNLWMGSKPHREAILHPKVSEIGTSVEYSSNNKMYVCAVLCIPFEGSEDIVSEVASRIINVAKKQGATAAKKILNDIALSKAMRWVTKSPAIQKIITALKQ